MSRDLMGFLLCSFIAFCAIKLIEAIIADLKPKHLKLKNTYTKLLQEAIYYCGPIYKNCKIKHYPQYEVSYYASKKKLGVYFSGQKKIVIYIHSHEGSESQRIKQIVHTILHECRHYQQHMTNADFKNYDIYSKKLTYQKNPFEIDSNAFADKHLDDCIKHLKEKGVIV